MHVGGLGRLIMEGLCSVQVGCVGRRMDRQCNKTAMIRGGAVQVGKHAPVMRVVQVGKNQSWG